ncbi:MAG: DUF5715 family protein [Acidobacteriaceae bacterium]
MPRFAWPGCFVLTFLLALSCSVPAFASTTSAAVGASHRSHRVRSRRYAGRYAGRRRTSTARVSAKRRPQTSAGVVHRSSSTHRKHRASRRSRYQSARLSARLDTIRAHANPAENSLPGYTEELPFTGGSHLEVPSPQDSLRDVPSFNLSVPRYMPVALRGSHEVLVHQNIVADVEGLSRIQNDAQLNAMVHSGDLVALPASSALIVDSRLPFNRRYCRPWTSRFLVDLSRAHESTFGRPLQLTSAVRTVDFQRHLARYNGNAAPAFGETASPHLTGQAIDLGKKGMSQHEIAWMRAILGQLQSSGKLDVEEEFEQACFHISVYKTYTPHAAPPARLVALNDAMPAESSVAKPAIRSLARPARLRVASARPPSHYNRTARRVPAHRRRRRHHASMSLLAARMR